MNQKDIRDIAAYLYARCTFEVLWKNWVSFDDHNVYSLLWEVLGKEQPPQVRNVKVYLRQIQSLTDDELTECARIDAGGRFLHGGVFGINRYSDELEVIYGNGAGVRFAIPHVYYADQSPGQVAETIAYLQSIGVYVPGTINEKYVELI